MFNEICNAVLVKEGLFGGNVQKCPKCEKFPTLRRTKNGLQYVCSSCGLSSGECISDSTATSNWDKAVLAVLRKELENRYA